MSATRTDLVAMLRERELVHQVTADDLGTLTRNERLSAYIGFDPTADSLHAGSLYQVMLLGHAARAGHDVVALLGGGTGRIGDPSGRSAERSLMDAEALRHNLDALGGQIRRLLERAGATAPRVLDNNAWLGTTGLLEFLCDIGKHFTVNAMVAKESVRARLEDRDHGISYTEFSYMLLQAYDFLRLHEDHGVRLQMGGSDQWGNITAGIDLIRRKTGGTAFGLTSPLLTDAAGRKFGKSIEGAVWLDPERTSPYRFHQFWLNQPDADASRLLAAYTFLPMEEVAALRTAAADGPPRTLQNRLADEVTTLVHGADATARARTAGAVLFGRGAVADLDAATLTDVFADVPSLRLPRDTVFGGDFEGRLARLCAAFDPPLVSSASDFRRQLKQGAIYLNDTRVEAGEDGDPRVTTADLLHDRFLVLRRGKKHYALVDVAASA